MNETHIIPLDDLREHAASTACWCKPKPDAECPDVFIHNAMDRRELYESGQLRPA